MDDVISIIEKLNIDDATPSEEPFSTYPKQPKLFFKALESVHLDEIGKIGTNISTGDDNEGSNLGDIYDINTSYNCELNFSVEFKNTSLEEVSSHD